MGSEEARLLNEENSLKDIERKSQESEVRSQEIRKRKDETTHKAAQIKNNIAVCLKDEERLNLTVGKALREKEELEKKSRESEVRSQALKSKKEELSGKKHDSARTQESASEQLKDSEARLAQKDSENLEGFKDGVRAIMLDKREEQPARIHGLVADVIETSARYEKAVEAVLGERLQYVIVESHEAGVEAVEYLKTQAKGRGSFVPLREAKIKGSESGVRSSESNAYQNTEQLISQVKVKDGYHPIAQYLLGDVLVTNNLNDAIALWKSNGLDKTFVTLEGEMVDPQGVITGGYSNGSDGGILQKRREIKELSNTVSDLEIKIRETEGEATRLRQEIEAGRANLDGLKKDSHSKEIELVNLEGELKREEAEISRLKQRLEVLESETGDASKELDAIAIKKAQFLKDREFVEAELEAAEKAIQAMSDEVAALSKKKDELSGLVTSIKVKLASSKERLEGIKAQIKDKQGFIADIGNRTIERQAGIIKDREETEGEESKVAKLKTELEDALKTMD
ncbi:MAG: hypothetical protein HZB81_03680, partial [Deltaproteobacteria bacterium]|nr:hypothetical protein [Deltaproteobacteria bacterium]